MYNGDETDEGYDVMRFLTAIVYPGKNGSRLDVVKDYIDFSHNPELREELGKMEGFGMSILQEGFEQGIEQGIEQERGRINLLNKMLRRDERLADLFRSLDDPDFQEQLLEEYGLQPGECLMAEKMQKYREDENAHLSKSTCESQKKDELDWDSFVLPSTRGKNVEEYMKEMREGD